MNLHKEKILEEFMRGRNITRENINDWLSKALDEYVLAVVGEDEGTQNCVTEIEAICPACHEEVCRNKLKQEIRNRITSKKSLS